MLPPRGNFVIKTDKIFICQKHWNADPPLIKLPGSSARPVIPLSLSNVPVPCLSTLKPASRPAKVEDKHRRYFQQQDTIASFDVFKPDGELQRNTKISLFQDLKEDFVCLFMTENFSEFSLSVIAENKPTFFCLLTFSVFKHGISLSLDTIPHPNNGLTSYTQVYEAVRLAVMHNIPFEKPSRLLLPFFQLTRNAICTSKGEKKLVYLTRQLQLLSKKQFSINGCRFAVEYYTRSSYE